MKRLPVLVAFLMTSAVATADPAPRVGVSRIAPPPRATTATRAVAAAVSRYVSPTGTDSATCGASEAPCKTVQAALDLSSPGDVVRLRAGTYTECVVSPGGVEILADAFVATAPLGTFALVALDGAGSCDRSGGTVVPGPVVTLAAGDQLKGVTVRHGGLSGIAAFGPVTLIGNLVTLNDGDNGGGIFVDTSGPVAASATTTIDQNIVQGNVADRDGGGIYVLALPSTPSSGTPSADVRISTNLIDGNRAKGGTLGAAGGGVAVFLQAAGPVTGTQTVTVTNNTIRGNVAENATAPGAVGYGGGLFAATSATGTGVETILVGDDRKVDTLIDSNTISLNTAGGYGGGAALLVQGASAVSQQAIDVDTNTVGLNSAGLGGGGLYLRQVAAGLGPATARSIRATGNTLNGNRSTGVEGETTGTVKGGGGICAETSSTDTVSSGLEFTLSGNSIRSNTSFSSGGGAALLLHARGAGGASPTPAAAAVDFRSNLVLGNAAANASIVGASGGGLYVATNPIGNATAVATLDLLTVTQNRAEIGTGGIELEASPGDDGTGTIGVSSVLITNSVVAFNDGYGVGGATFPDGINVLLSFGHNDLFGNATSDLEPGLPNPVGTGGNFSADPELDAQGAPKTCSPTIDAGDPAAPAALLALEPQPNGGRLNIGHLGGTSAAIRTFPDVNGDDRVDGLDLLAVATAFNSVTTSAWYKPAADRDIDGDVDGDDLSYIAAFYGQDLAVLCP